MGFAPNQCVVIEDSISGIQAARAGGFEVNALGQEKYSEQLTKEGATAFFIRMSCIACYNSGQFFCQLLA